MEWTVTVILRNGAQEDLSAKKRRKAVRCLVMDKIFHSDHAYEKWNRKNRDRGIDFEEEREESYLKGLKGRIQNNLSAVPIISASEFDGLFLFGI